MTEIETDIPMSDEVRTPVLAIAESEIGRVLRRRLVEDRCRRCSPVDEEHLTLGVPDAEGRGADGDTKHPRD